MAYSEILQAYAIRKLDQPLRDVSIKEGDTVLLTGHGSLRTREDGSLVVEFITNGRFRDFVKDSKPGEVTFPTAHPVLEALMEDGNRLRAHVSRSSPSSWTETGGRITFSPWEVEIHIDHQVKFSPHIMGLLTPFATELANTYSFVKDDNPMFGREAMYSWLKLDLDGASVGLRKEESGFCWLSFTEQGTKSPDVVRHAEAFLTALSFLVGEAVSWLAFTTFVGESEIIRLRQPPNKKRGLLQQPLPACPTLFIGNPESDVLVKGTTFFHANARVGHWLMLCWNAAGGYFPTQCLVVSSVVESLAKFITKDAPQAVTLKPEKEKFDDFKKVCVSVLQNSEDTKSSGFLERIVNRINSTDYLRYEESIKKAGEILRPADPIQISDDETSAWSKLRNSTAHGDFQTGQESLTSFLEQMRRYDCCVNIINKLVLGLIGYKGPFRDYSKSNYPNETL
jgi:hypothetical protein